MADPAIEALDRTTAGLVGIAEAREVTGITSPRLLLHAGPPLTRGDEVPGPIRGAVVAALLFEGEARDVREAQGILDAEEVELTPCHHVRGVGAMAGVVSPHMPVVVASSPDGVTSFSPMNEGLGRAMRFGTHDDQTVRRLRWMRSVLLPVLDRAVKAGAPIELTEIQAEALRRGDECHNRNVAATAALLLRLAPALVRSNKETADVADVLDWASSNPHFFLPFSMAAAKIVATSAHGVTGSPIVTAIAANGVDVGIQVSGCGERWFRAPAPIGEVKCFEGFTREDGQPMMGDSYITETVGLGALSLSASPAIGSFLGVTAAQGRRAVDEAREICAGTSSRFLLAAQDFEGAPLGIDVRSVAESHRAPCVNSGVAHRNAGVGQIGAGLVTLPLAPFREAAELLGSPPARASSPANDDRMTP